MHAFVSSPLRNFSALVENPTTYPLDRNFLHFVVDVEINERKMSDVS